ncbi:cell surface glycoprotein CD200 receptor 1 isoform X2 [Chelmon rostratus]|uniref:cell surface glycoprotein CD200 receptor 1 isoform X2 n=1 Tax=Chelmon rostratus TaxID=109905 RepID=UPI001BEAD114|nr:cell surface glycoprotein CD200 receptor 1 isoform X2 [Chelmon rostratus]
MRDMMWIYGVFMVLLSEAWSQDPVVRHSAFNLGSDADLICSDKTWNETIFVIWNIKLKSKDCKISFSNDGQSVDFCNDDKSLLNNSRAQSYLHIPNFSHGDVGIYKCESVYKGGIENYEINVDITVPPSTSSWLERRGDKMEAVCKAERGKPAANISWSYMGNQPSVKMYFQPHGFVTVESRLELPEGMDTQNLSCAVSHPSWDEKKVLEPKPEKGFLLWLYIPVVMVIVVFLAGFVFLAQKKLMTLRRYQHSATSPSKSAPREDVEEVEPYASYVQRVNSIYNSSVDLFT